MIIAGVTCARGQCLTSLWGGYIEFKPYHTGIPLLAGEPKPMHLAFMGGAAGLGKNSTKIDPLNDSMPRRLI